METILIWEPMYGHVGHVSMLVSENLYISLWPVDEYPSWKWILDFPVASMANSYDDDCIAEGDDRGNRVIPRSPDREIEVEESLNRRKLSNWWDVFQHEGYKKSNNCIDAVKKALNVGGISRFRMIQLHWELSLCEAWFTSNCIVRGGTSKNKKS